MIELTGYQDKHEYVNKHGVKSVVYLMDNMDAMAQMGENEFSLACVDPPYGIGEDGGDKKRNRGYNKVVTHKKKVWDSKVPNQEYFDLLKKVSENQIIWGANYMIDKIKTPSMGWIFWDKRIGGDFSDGELAWTSFKRALKMFSYSHVGDTKGGHERIHPTQKAEPLYDWIFHNYAKPNDAILDTHLGSGSSRIAADKHNLPFTGIELDPDYFRDHCKRFDRYTAQQTLF